MQVINHGSIHHAGFLSDRTIFALSHDEDFSVHPATDPDEPGEGPEPVQFGDVREPLACEYVAQLCIGSQGPYMAAGNKMYVYSCKLFPCPARVSPFILNFLEMADRFFFLFCLSAVISAWIWSHWYLVQRGSLIRITPGVFLVRMVMKLCALFISMSR